METDRLLTREEAAQLLALRPQTLARWAMDGQHLRIVKLGRTVRYKLSDVLRLAQLGPEQAVQ